MGQRNFKEIYNGFCRGVTSNQVLKTVILIMLLVYACSLVSCSARQREERAAAEKEEQRIAEASLAAFHGELEKTEPEPVLLADGTSLDQVRIESEYMAKAKYAMRNNSHAALKMADWCIILRKLNPDYPDSIEEVCSQKGQFMGWAEDNPVLQPLQKSAYEELIYFHNGGYLPRSSDYVYMEWTPEKVFLFTDFERKNNCHYFYEEDWETFEAARSEES